MPQIRDLETQREALSSKYRDWDAYEDIADTDDATPFKDLLQRDPCVCDHCFQLRYEEIAHEWSQGELGWMKYNNWVTIPNRSTRIPDDDGHGTRLACANCGHRTTKRRPLSKSEVRDVAQNISQTLDEKNIDHDPEVLFHTVERRNTSANQGKQDSHVFAPAVRAAIEAAYQETRSAAAPYQ